ncbi:MAG: hypothetical protein E7448_05020 [Ruminococcaceae bacterium]|nr:hypothetical protein [Oscillospiraceae bacterium]
MKKLIVTLLAIALLCSFAAPAMADESNSPVKDYATAEEGELLYTYDFSGKDGVLQMGNIGNQHADEYFYYNPSEDGTSLTVYGREDADKETYAAYYGATIPSLEGNFTTTYTMTYKVAMHGDVGLNNSCGVGAYFISGDTGDSMSVYNLYGNYSTKTASGSTSMRRSSLSINNQKQADYVQWNTLPAYEVDADGYVTAMLVYEGSSLLMTAYIRAEGAGDGSKESDWIKVEELTYVPSEDCMGFFIYSYYVTDVNVTVKDAKLYKGKIFAEEKPVQPTEPETEPSEEPTTKPTTKPTTAPTEAPASDSASEFPIGIVIGIAAALIVAVVVVVIVLKKKKA